MSTTTKDQLAAIRRRLFGLPPPRVKLAELAERAIGDVKNRFQGTGRDNPVLGGAPGKAPSAPSKPATAPAAARSAASAKSAAT